MGGTVGLGVGKNVGLFVGFFVYVVGDDGIAGQLKSSKDPSTARGTNKQMTPPYNTHHRRSRIYSTDNPRQDYGSTSTKSSSRFSLLHYNVLYGTKKIVMATYQENQQENQQENRVMFLNHYYRCHLENRVENRFDHQ